MEHRRGLQRSRDKGVTKERSDDDRGEKRETERGVGYGTQDRVIEE